MWYGGLPNTIGNEECVEARTQSINDDRITNTIGNEECVEARTQSINDDRIIGGLNTRHVSNAKWRET